MNHSELKDLKQLAMVAELARPLAHECNNFLNNLLLQLAISEKSFPESSRAEWANLRREGRKLAGLFQQWQRQHKQPSQGPATCEINQVIHQLVDELHTELAASRFLVRPAASPLLLKGFKCEVQRLFSLLLRYAVAAQWNDGADRSVIELQLGLSGDRILVRLLHAGAKWADFDETASSERAILSLPALACKSLVERLDGNARTESDSNGGMALVIDLPLAVD